MRELIGLLRYRGEALTQRINSVGQDAAAEVSDLFLLQLSNRYESLLLGFAGLSNLHPLRLYEVLVQLAAELATFTREEKRPLTLPLYQHCNLQQSFSVLMLELRRSLSTVLEQTALSIPLLERQYGIWVATIADKTLLEKTDFVLAVYADMGLDDLKQQFSMQTKIAPVEEIRTLVTKALPGINLQELATAPRQIPYHTKFVYFMLDNTHCYWQKLAKSGGLAVAVGGGFAGLKLELWVIRG